MFIEKIMDMLIPRTCILCQKRSFQKSIDLCMSCEQSLPYLGPHCRGCGRTLPNLTLNLCGSCLKYPFPFQTFWALVRYEDLIPEIITRFKFHEHLLLAHVFGSLMGKHLLQRYQGNTPQEKEAQSENELMKPLGLPSCMIPIPLHFKRLKVRGYNQALELSRPIARALQIPLWTKAVIRVNNTRPQSELSLAKRKKNLNQAFHWNLKESAPKHLALVDDVFTTGSTIRSISKTLIQAGAERIDVWILARA